MKTKLLKRLRREAFKRYPAMMYREFALSIGMTYEKANEYIRTKRTNYVLRRVRELKQRENDKGII